MSDQATGAPLPEGGADELRVAIAFRQDGVIVFTNTANVIQLHALLVGLLTWLAAHPPDVLAQCRTSLDVMGPHDVRLQT